LNHLAHSLATFGQRTNSLSKECRAGTVVLVVTDKKTHPRTGSKGIALLILNHGTRSPRRFIPGNNPPPLKSQSERFGEDKNLLPFS